MSNTRTQSITALKGTNNFHFHRLLPDENSDYVLNASGSFPKNWEVDIPYASLDPTPIASTLYIKKIAATILGPKVPCQGGFLLVIEKEGDSAHWLPILVVDDGQYSGSFEWPDGYELPMTNDLQFCASTQFNQYSSGSSWTFGTNLYRAVELDIFYHVGT